MKKFVLKWMGVFLIINFSVFSQDIDKGQLEHLRKIGVISQEDYDILSGQSQLENGKSFYELIVNGELKNDKFQLLKEGEILYFPLKNFLESIDFTNYKETPEKIEISLGDSLKNIEINFKDKFIKEKDQIIINNFTKEQCFKKDNEIYLSKKIFERLFLNSLRIDDDNYKLKLILNFNSPEDIAVRLGQTKDILKESSSSKELYYTNQLKLFELGYMRVQLDQIYRKGTEGKKYKSDWDGNLEYQGATLYGNLTTSYDLKNNVLGDTYLRYDNLWEKHTLELGSYQSGYGKSRELGLSFKKDKGYIIGSDKTYIIRENVPIGSRVELLYLGIPIAIEDSKDGFVEFKNSEIKSDREYTLKVYEPNGKIYEKTINTTSDYNQQNKGQIEYDVNLREDEASSKIRSYSNVYYGLTNNLTLGFGYRREPQYINKDYKYIDSTRLEGVYSNFIYNFPYTVVVGSDKVWNKIKDNTSGKNLHDKYSYDVLSQIDIDKFRFKIKNKESGKYYDEKNRQEYSVKYTPLRSLELQYDYEKVEDQLNKYRKNGVFTADYSKSIKDLLISAEYRNSQKDKTSYGLNFYYNGFRAFSTRLENKWLNDGKDYETSFSIFNSGNGMVDYTFTASYSELNKDLFTFKFSIQYDNLFSFDFFGDKNGTREYKFGLDRIIDLKHPLTEIDSMDSSRVKIKTFIDMNNNNKYDEGEIPVNNVVVNIGDKKIVTDNNGEGYFYGIPNHIVYDLKPTIRKPSFVLGGNKIVIEGRSASTLTAYIPVKPMVTLTGIVNIEDSFKKTPEDKIRTYENLLVRIKDLNGKIIETTMPDETGVFEVSGLFPKKYFIEVIYIGGDMNIRGVNKVVQLKYVNNEDDNIINFDVSSQKITMNKEGSEEWLG
ncbi:MAG: hypothetical protein ACRC1R_02610 [Cetobacterium sp.]|uniref:hypothetical protein n=1 Tax=Cetobacterium sp. TaxID=2071632 RepID=UPI003F334357